ncbi:MmcQ/YjbR family DNA-binding protein [Corynebacterium halotolerans]|uniref:MmcQ/YjbR family DNA-binding protein n=1 Tax=Corynebacterium halotolerans TaxID=225326 RepID=UPI00034DF3EB|nr:MmcQ/YjbR family DNA-binding protein [Corynebacterium halotolerans]
MTDGQTLQEIAQERAESLPGAVLEHPFGPGYGVYKVRGKMFLLLTSVPEHSTGYGVRDSERGQRVIVVKAEPDDAEALRRQYEDISPGYHMNKRNWITVAPGHSIGRKLVEELVTDSYRLVVATLPRARRPVDPETYGS